MLNKIIPHDHGQDMEKVLEKMPTEPKFDDAADTFQQLCDSTRLRILWLLCHSEQCVCNIAAIINMSDSAVSHHLRNLKQNKLISSRREGKEVHYTLADNEKAHLVHRMIDDYFNMKCPTNIL